MARTARNKKRTAFGLTATEFQQLQTIPLEILGERLRRARIDKRLSQQALTEGLFSAGYLSALELGRTSPTPLTLQRLAERLGKSVAYFVHPVEVAGLAELNVEQSNAVQAQFTLLSTQVKLSSGNLPQANLLLEELKLHLGRLTPLERARLHYLAGLANIQAGAYPAALDALAEANLLLAEASQNRSETLELQVLVSEAQGKAEARQGRLSAALFHYRYAFSLLNFEAENNPVPTELETGTGTGVEGSKSAQVAQVAVNPGTSLSAGNLRQRQFELLTTNLRQELHLALANTYLALGGSQCQEATPHLEAAFSSEAALAGGTVRAERAANNYLALAQIYQRQGEYTVASFYLGRSEQGYLARTDYAALVELYKRLAQLRLKAGAYEAAEQAALAALRLELSLSNPNPDAGASSIANLTVPLPLPPIELLLAHSYLRQGKLAEATQLIETQTQALLAQTSTEPESGRESEGEAAASAVLHLRLELYRLTAELAVAKDERTTAEIYYQKAIRLLEEVEAGVEGNYAALKKEIYYSYGQQLRKWGDSEKAFDYLDKALRLRQGQGSR